MPLNPTAFNENDRSVPTSGQNVFEIDRYRRTMDTARFPSNPIPGRRWDAKIIPFEEILKNKEKKDAIKRLQERTGLGFHDARNVIETLPNKDVSLWDTKEERVRPRSKRLFWFLMSLAAVGLIWFVRF